MELMIVIVLMGILTATILPEMTGTFEEARLRTTGRKLVSLCDLAGSRAVTRCVVHRVRYDSKENCFVIDSRRRTEEEGIGFAQVNEGSAVKAKVEAGISVAIRKGDAIEPTPEDSQRPPPEPGSETDRDASQPMQPTSPNVVTFYPDGTAERAEIQLRDRQGFRMALRIHPVTARVRLVPLARQEKP